MATTTQISSPSDSLIITSPTLSASSPSSPGLDFVAVGRRVLYAGKSGKTGITSKTGEESSFSDDDEIVWAVSENEDAERFRDGTVDSDDDFVVLGHSTPSQSRLRVGSTTSRSAATQGCTTGGILLNPEVELQYNYDRGDSVRDGMVPVDEPAGSDLEKALASLTVGGHTLVKGETCDFELPGAKNERTVEVLMRLLNKNKRKKRREQAKGTESKTAAGSKTAGKAVKPEKGKKSKHKSTTTPASAPEHNLAPSSCNPQHFIAEDTPANSPLIISPLKKKGKKSKVAQTVHEVTGQISNKLAPTAYDEAVSYITSYISNESAHHDRICHLTLLQSLIIELGLITELALLPRSIRSAKKFIKLRVFLNVKEYLKKRDQGPEVVQSLLFPSRSALVKDMKQKKNFASLQWIKKQGLQDLLVGVFHR